MGIPRGIHVPLIPQNFAFATLFPIDIALVSKMFRQSDHIRFFLKTLWRPP